MDKKELLKRWALAYTKPSLFYVPCNKKIDNEYFTITLVPHIDYFDTYDEKLLTDVYLRDIYTKRILKERQGQIGGINVEDIWESNTYIAKDLKGNIIATSRVFDYMSVAKKIKDETICEHNIEYYETNLFSDSNRYRYVIKNIEDFEVMDMIKSETRNISSMVVCFLFILKTGEIYVYNSINNFNRKLVGTYDYISNRYHFTDKNYYQSWMMIHCGDGQRYNNETEVYSHPILKLKRGTYIIEQLISSKSCDIMNPIKIDVTGDMIINYHTTLNGFILRSYLTNNSESCFVADIQPSTDNRTLKLISTGKFGTFRSTTQTFGLSDYKLKIEQTIKMAGVYKSVPVNNGKEWELYGSNSMWVVTESTSHSILMRDEICYPASLSEETILNLPYSYWMGTDAAIGRVNYDSNFYLIFTLDKIIQDTPFDLNKLPNILEVEKIISSKSPEEWEIQGVQTVNDFYNIKYSRRFQFQGNFFNYFTKTGEKGTCFDDVLLVNENSPINVVENYSKNTNVDIETYKQYLLSSSRYDLYYKDSEAKERREEKRIFKNYVTYVSGEIKYAKNWDWSNINSMIEEVSEKIFNEQL